MSREIIVLGGYAGLMAAACGLAWLNWTVLAGKIDAPFAGISILAGGVSAVAALTGLLGLFCSIQIYAVTGRPLWRFDRTVLRFGGTSALLGMAGFTLALLLSSAATSQAQSSETTLAAAPLLFFVIAALTASKLWAESGPLIYGDAEQSSPESGTREGIALERTRILLASSLEILKTRRRRIAQVTGIALSLLCAGLVALGAPLVLILCLGLLVFGGSLGGELLERSLFFRSEATPAMPRAN